MLITKEELKLKLNSCYGTIVTIPTLTDDEIIQKDYEQFSYAIECMDNEFYGGYGI